MFSQATSTAAVCLFSSSGSHPLQLCSAHLDALLPTDSLVHLLNDATSSPPPLAPGVLASLPQLSDTDNHGLGRQLDQTVLHIQSPTLRTTFIHIPSTTEDLGFKHRWMHIQARNLRKECSFEFGLKDALGRQGIVRCSTFQKTATLRVSGLKFPLLHLPFRFSEQSSGALTAWSTIALDLHVLLSKFASSGLVADDNTHNIDVNDDSEATSPTRRSQSSAPLPRGRYGHLSFVRVYATCRLRRIWLSEGPSQKTPWEFELYGTN
ncbi:hypothetical protein BDV98DRAFT_501641 [Pterulicium gracile]|uniref:CFA20 domain-containing protein n=1 Tax=Pterulicium gracile TaxID=1884261 RepID=A0A5C3QWK8_9AGAR|nr:hypothetical protein BDV98DRAFT_501641 [Pterula gracilis]